MARQVPVGWEVAAGRRSFSAVSFRIRCLCRTLWRQSRSFLRNLLRFTGKDFRLPHHHMFQPPPIISIRRLFLCLKSICSHRAPACAQSQKCQNAGCFRRSRRHQRGAGAADHPDARRVDALLSGSGAHLPRRHVLRSHPRRARGLLGRPGRLPVLRATATIRCSASRRFSMV